MRALRVLAVAALLAGGLAPRPAPAVSPGRWVAGDLDVHSTYSPQVCSVPPLPSNCDPDGDGAAAPATAVGSTPVQQVQEAAKRGLDFIAITDEDRPGQQGQSSAQTDLAQYEQCHAAGDPACPVLVVDGMEKSLAGPDGSESGRLTVVGWTGPFPADPTAEDGWSAGDLAAAIGQIHAAGGLVMADRPASAESAWTYDPAQVPIDGWDVWSGPYLDQSELFGSAAADNPQADSAWMGAAMNLAPAGRHLTPVGGSDAHTLASSLYDGPGQPTLWAYDTLDSQDGPVTWAGVRDAIAGGRVTISAGTPADRGPLLYLDTADGSFMSGDTVDVSGGEWFQTRVTWAHAPIGARIRFVGVARSSPPGVGAVGFTITTGSTDGWALGPKLQFRPGRWYRAEMYVEDLNEPYQDGMPSRASLPCMPAWPTSNPCLRDRWLMLAVAGPIFAPS